ncbi:MAG: flavin reductase [Planctomycetes bacterium]|nr:flavin reductase [Planctomycetota bacterium]
MNEDAKKTLLRFIPHGLYVITTGAGDSAHGFTATWMTQASFKPPLVAIGVRRDSHAFTTIAANGSFIVNFVGKNDRAICEKFFQPPKSENQHFGNYAFSPAPVTGGPALTDALAWLECKVTDIVDRGDHAVVVGEVVGANIIKAGDPLVLADTPWKYGG